MMQKMKTNSQIVDEESPIGYFRGYAPLIQIVSYSFLVQGFARLVFKH